MVLLPVLVVPAAGGLDEVAVELPRLVEPVAGQVPEEHGRGPGPPGGRQGGAAEPAHGTETRRRRRMGVGVAILLSAVVQGD